MHQWSTSTYKAVNYFNEAEYHTWQVILPREGLKHPFLLHGFLAIASLETVVTETRPNMAGYVSASLEYHDSDLEAFRSELANITPDKLQAVLTFSLITAILSLALPQFAIYSDEPQSMRENMVA